MDSFSAAYEGAQLEVPQLRSERATPAAAFAAARAAYLAGERVDMLALSAELGIARTTLYRWTGGRDQLLSDVIWDLSDTLIAHVWAQSESLHGEERLLSALRAYAETIAHSQALQAFLRNETHAALRLLTTRGPFQNRLVEGVRRLIVEEQVRADFPLAAEPQLVAYGAVRIVESFVYNDAIAAVELAIDDAITILRLIFQ